MAWRVFHLTLRFLLELVALAVLGYWGFVVGQGQAWQWLLALAAPLFVAVVWGLWIAPRARYALNPWLKEGLALLVFGSTALALVAVEQATWGIIFLGVALVNSVVVFRAKDEPLPDLLKGK